MNRGEFAILIHTSKIKIKEIIKLTIWIKSGEILKQTRNKKTNKKVSLIKKFKKILLFKKNLFINFPFNSKILEIKKRAIANKMCRNIRIGNRVISNYFFFPLFEFFFVNWNKNAINKTVKT